MMRAHVTSTMRKLRWRTLILALTVMVALSGSGCHAKRRGVNQYAYGELRDTSGSPVDLYFTEELGLQTADGEVINWLYTNGYFQANNPSTMTKQRLNVEGGVEVVRSVIRLPSYTTSQPTATMLVSFNVTLMGRWEPVDDSEEPAPGSNDPFPAQMQLLWQPTGPQAWISRSRTKSDFISYVEPETSSSNSYSTGSQRYNTNTPGHIVVTRLDTNTVLFNDTVSCAPEAEFTTCAFQFGSSVDRYN